MSITGNIGEWSELYTFFRLLRDGRIYAADENVNRIDSVYFPIIKVIREEENTEYTTGQAVKIYKNGKHLDTISLDFMSDNAELLLNTMLEKAQENGDRSFSVDGIESVLETMIIEKIKQKSEKKADIVMQVHDINTGYSPVVGYSIKSDIGAAPTLLNASLSTRVSYEITGLSDEDIENINAINTKNKLKERMSAICSKADKVTFAGIDISRKCDTFENNLIMVDSLMPQLYGEIVLEHYRSGNSDCKDVLDTVAENNPLNYKRKTTHSYKFKKLLCAVALGMVPAKEWSGNDEANGGYIIVKKDGNVLCYHLYNRDFFETYLYNNVKFDRPSSSRHQFMKIYEMDNKKYIDLNVQIRFK